MELKPQDLVVLYKQVAQANQTWTYASLGEALGMSASQVHRSVKRAVASGLALEKSRGEWETVRTALHEFAVHGVRYAFPCRHRAAKARHSDLLWRASSVHCHFQRPRGRTGMAKRAGHGQRA